MKEVVLVVSTEGKFARVRVEEGTACDSCSARSLCIGKKQRDGTILVLNPLSSRAGDCVTIEIPETGYSRALIILFGVLLGAVLIGLIIGHLASLLLPVSSTVSSFIGFLVGLVLGVIYLIIYFRGKRLESLYPVITEVVNGEKSTGQRPEGPGK